MTKNKTDKFDITYLKSISNNDKTFIKEVLRLYVETSQIAVTKLESDLEKGDFKSIEFLLHRMRSSIMPFSLTNLNEQLKKTEQDIGENNISNVPKEIKLIIGQVKKSILSSEIELQKL